MFLGDAHSPVLVDAIKRLLAKRGEEKLVLDAVKLPHHGSRNNVSRELIELLDCRRFLISTNGNIFEHPDAESIARIIKYGGRAPDIYFNYLSETTKDLERCFDPYRDKCSFPGTREVRHHN